MKHTLAFHAEGKNPNIKKPQYPKKFPLQMNSSQGSFNCVWFGEDLLKAYESLNSMMRMAFPPGEPEQALEAREACRSGE